MPNEMAKKEKALEGGNRDEASAGKWSGDARKLQSEIARELQLENSRLKRLTYAELEMLFPSVPWRDPIRISDPRRQFRVRLPLLHRPSWHQRL